MAGKKDKSPERTCILSGEVLDKSQMIRFVLSPDDQLTPDLASKLPGRGLYVQADRLLIEQAIEKKKLVKAVARSLKQSVKPDMLPDDLLGLLTKLLRRKVLDRLGLEQRAGHIVTGFDKIKAALGKKARPAMVFHADDAGSDGQKKIAFCVNGFAEVEVPEQKMFTREELSLALGKDNVVHVLLLKGAALDKLEADIGRLNGIRG